jgi:predicted amidohydrolase YtcJ
MAMTRRAAGWLASCVVAAAALQPAGSQPLPADLVLVNGTILTVDATDSIARAVAIAGGKIIAVGSDGEIRARIGPSTRVIDLRGRTATPGLIDTHCHFQESIGQLDLGDPSIRSVADVIARIRQHVATLKPGEWVRGRGWDEGKLAERRYLYASDLDKAAPGNPVWLGHTTGHYGVANSAALRLAGITRETKDPPAGTIDRDKDGNPTGVLKESASGLVTRVITSAGGGGRGGDQGRAAVLKIIDGFNREGMTGVKDPGISAGRWDLYNQLLKEDRLTVRVFALWRGGRTLDSARQTAARLGSLPRAPASLGDGRLLTGGVKLYMDGSGGARTGWMHEPWNKDFTGTDGANVGYPTTEPEIFRQQVRLLHDAGIHVSTHAVGDRAIDVVVDTYAEVLQAKPTRGLRHGIIHANIPTDHAIDTMARLQEAYDAGYPEAQSTFMWWIGDTYAGNFGRARGARLMPFRTYLAKGVLWAGGSDFSVTPYPARYGIWASVARKTLTGAYGATPFGTAEAIDARTALRSYTIWAARQMFLEDRIGSIEPGKDADIAVWDRNMYSIAADEIQHLKCELTLVAGRIVHDASARERAARRP